MSDRIGVAAFDFDGTLTSRDALVPFVLRFGGIRSIPGLGRVRLADLRSRDRSKAALLRWAMASRPVAELEAAGQAYADRLLRRIREDAVRRLAHHRAEHHRIVIVSASLQVYLEPLARRLGLDGVEAVELEEHDGLLTGEMVGPNCRGPEKVRRLDRWLGGQGLTRSDIELWAYGDSPGDDDLLAVADHPHRCGPPGRLRPGRSPT